MPTTDQHHGYVRFSPLFLCPAQALHKLVALSKSAFGEGKSLSLLASSYSLRPMFVLPAIVTEASRCWQ